MNNNLALFILIFVLVGIILRGVIQKIYFKNTTSKVRRRGEYKLVYWQTIIYSTIGTTMVIMLFLRWIDVVNF